MARKPRVLIEGEYYHIYNRGTDKRNIFMDQRDIQHFLKLISVLNTTDSIGSLHELSFEKHPPLGGLTPKWGNSPKKLVEFVCFCLLPNHYHFLLKQVSETGISILMQKLGTAYSLYFNNKHKRSGNLFQGRFKDIHIETNEYLLHLSTYINLNFRVHGKWQKEKSLLYYSSWKEYCGENSDNLCAKGIILDQFADIADYKIFAENSLFDIRSRRAEDKVLSAYLME